MPGPSEARHPQYTSERVDEWRLMRDVAEGESAVKKEGQKYLPMPSGFRGMQDGGAAAYNAYRARGTFPEILAPSLSAMIGIAHGKEIDIQMPDALQYLWEDADGDGLQLEVFHRSITRELLLVGRYGVLADAPAGGGEPYLAGYTAESIINWDDEFFVLDETAPQRTGFEWEVVPRFRVLSVEDGRYIQRVYGDTDEILEEIDPRTLGGQTLAVVPFAVASPVDVKPDIRTSPLIGVARAARAIYQLDVDQRHQLYMSGQETLIGINCDPPEIVGAGVSYGVHGTEGLPVDVRYVSPTCAGIDAHDAKIKDMREAAVMAGARLLEQSAGVQESGAARQLRFASETATLTSVLLASCELLERGLRNVALLKGLPTDDIVVNAPATLLDQTMAPADAEALVRMWQQGAISYETLHENLRRGGIASPERDADQEFALTEQDDVDALTPAQAA